MNYFLANTKEHIETINYMELNEKIIPYKKVNGKRVPIVLKLPIISSLSIEKMDSLTFKITKENLYQYTHTDESHDDFFKMILSIKNIDTFNNIEFQCGKNMKVKGIKCFDEIYNENKEYNLIIFVVIREIEYKKVIFEVRHIEAKEQMMDLNVIINDESDNEETENENENEDGDEDEDGETENLEEYEPEEYEEDVIQLNDKKTTIKNLYKETLIKAQKAQELAQIYFGECEKLRQMYYELDNE